MDAFDQAKLQREVMPTVEPVLPQIEELVGGLGEIDTDPAEIILFHGRLGLDFWFHRINNEFTAGYAQADDGRVLQGFGEIFAEG